MRNLMLMSCWNGGIGQWIFGFRVLSQAYASYCQIFPGYVTRAHAISKTSVLAKLKEKRAALKLRNSVVAA
jgi:hypothetical protein